MDISELPLELQLRILTLLTEKDLQKAYQVSFEWQCMVRNFMEKYYLTPIDEWRWYCRHSPQLQRCSQCYERFLSRCKDRIPPEWKWWYENSS